MYKDVLFFKLIQISVWLPHFFVPCQIGFIYFYFSVIEISLQFVENVKYFVIKLYNNLLILRNRNSKHYPGKCLSDFLSLTK